MKIKVTDNIVDYTGKVLTSKEFDEMGVMKITTPDWRDIIHRALNLMDDKEPMSTENKIKSFQITNKIFKSDEVDLTPSEITYILQKIEKRFAPIVVGRARELFGEEKSE